MRQLPVLSLVMVLSVPLSPIVGQTPKSKIVPGAEVQKKVTRLTGLVHWHSDLEEAKKIARQEKKGIFWLHALGDLDGDC
jgi:hypothetical protein